LKLAVSMTISPSRTITRQTVVDTYTYGYTADLIYTRQTADMMVRDGTMNKHRINWPRGVKFPTATSAHLFTFLGRQIKTGETHSNWHWVNTAVICFHTPRHCHRPNTTLITDR